MLTVLAALVALLGRPAAQLPLVQSAPAPAGDPPVSVAFSATGGTIRASGLFTAGERPGSFRVVAAAGRYADTVAVTLAPAPAAAASATDPPASGAASGIPFGPYAAWRGTTLRPNTDEFTAAVATFTPGELVTALGVAHDRGKKLLVAMTGGSHANYMTDGAFDMAKWRSRMDEYNTTRIRDAVAAAVANGTLIGNSVMDEPHVRGLGDGNTWGPPGTMTKARVDSLCGYVKSIFPTLPAGVVHPHGAFEPSKAYRVCDFLVDQYSARQGSVTKFRDDGLALVRRDRMAIIFSLNILNGGEQAPRRGQWDCPAGLTGGRGLRSPNCRMTPDQVRDWGILLGTAGCAMVLWRYENDFMADPASVQAFRDVAGHLSGLPSKSCRRRP